MDQVQDPKIHPFAQFLLMLRLVPNQTSFRKLLFLLDWFPERAHLQVFPSLPVVLRFSPQTFPAQEFQLLPQLLIRKIQSFPKLHFFQEHQPVLLPPHLWLPFHCFLQPDEPLH